MMRLCLYYWRIALFFLGTFLVPVDNCLAQPPANTYSIAGWWGPAPPPFSPVVQADKSITFRMKAPAAKGVDLLFGEWNVKPQPLAKDSTGVWSVTLPPVAPGIYSYLFSVDGIQTVDFNNPVTKAGTQIYSSIVEVPGNAPRFDEIQPTVPHGVLETIRYTSSVLHRLRSMVLYLPPSYFSQPQQTFPILYLRHGGGDNETSWTQAAGRADIILENLIAKGKATPMIIVMTNGLTDGTWAGGSTPEAMKALETELLTEVIPLIESRYRVKKEPSERAIAGLSMGGGQAFVMGLRNTSTFSWVGEFSAGLLSDKDLNLDKLLPGMVKGTVLNSKLKLLWVGCGTEDPRYPGHLVLKEALDKRGVTHEFQSGPGGHEWRVWREQLAGFLQKIFK